MNVIKSMSRLTAIAVLMASACGVAQAGVAPGSNTATQTATLQFAAAGDASISLTPVSGLKSGITNETIVATGTATSDKAGNQVAIRWTPLSGEVDGTCKSCINIAGKNTGEKVLFTFEASSLTQSVADTSFFYSANNQADINIRVNKYPGAPVPADTFTLSMDAAVWAE